MTHFDTNVPKVKNSTGRLRLTIALVLLTLTLAGPVSGAYLVVFAEGDATKGVNGLADVVVDTLALGLFLTALPPMVANLIVSRRGARRYPARSPWFKAIVVITIAGPLGLAGFSFLVAVVMLSGPNGSF